MTKHSVWLFSLLIAVLSVASMGYRLFTPGHFESSAWRNADEPAEFLERRAMMSDVEQLFLAGKLGTADAATRLLGTPERTADDNPNTWYYNLGGQRSSAAPESISWLEMSFDDSGRLLKHRTVQELIVPPR